MTRPMLEEERKEALADAKGIVLNAGKITGLLIDETHLLLARALLSTSASERGLREALERIKGMPGPMIDGPTGTAKFLAYDAVLEIIDAALSPKGEDELARGQGRSAPTDRL